MSPTASVRPASGGTAVVCCVHNRENAGRRAGFRPRPDEAAFVLLLRKPVHRTHRHLHVLPDLSRAADPHSGRAST